MQPQERRSGPVTRAASTPIIAASDSHTVTDDPAVKHAMDVIDILRSAPRPLPPRPRSAWTLNERPPADRNADTTADLTLMDPDAAAAFIAGDFWGAVGGVYIDGTDGNPRMVSLAYARRAAA